VAPASTSLPAAARSTSCRYVSRVIIGHQPESRSWAARAARLPSWMCESRMYGSDQQVRAPTAVNKRHADASVLGWGFPKLQVRRRRGFPGTADATEYTLTGCPGTKPCLSTSFLFTRPIHPHHSCRIVRLLLRALHRTINTVEKTTGVCVGRCVNNEVPILRFYSSIGPAARW
jgi:hypothetical protein